jgi:hypothetical protein
VPAKRNLTFSRTPASTNGVLVTIRRAVTGFSLRVVDASRLPVEFEVARKDDPDWANKSWSVDEGEPWTEDGLCLEGDLELLVRADGATEIIELLTWEG